MIFSRNCSDFVNHLQSVYSILLKKTSVYFLMECKQDVDQNFWFIYLWLKIRIDLNIIQKYKPYCRNDYGKLRIALNIISLNLSAINEQQKHIE